MGKNHRPVHQKKNLTVRKFLFFKIKAKFEISEAAKITLRRKSEEVG